MGTKKRPQRVERRFEPRWSTAAVLTLAGIALGGVAVGAGAYGQWLAAQRPSYAPWLLAAGAVGLAAVIIWGELQAEAVRVGDAGVALERGAGPAQRVAWCDIDAVRLDGAWLRVEGPMLLKFRVAANPLAAAWVVREAHERIPRIVKLDPSSRESLPATDDADGQVVAVEPTQVTGRRCKASGQVITFERDGRYCGRCGQIYHRDAMPDTCATCEVSLHDHAMKVS